MTVVCIAGMHRSGTSMVARMLNLCGVQLGAEDELLPAATDNPEGFWENKNFVSINEKILLNLKSTWDQPPVLEPGWELSSSFDELRKEAMVLIAAMNGDASWGWKDPRTSLTLPFWRQLIPHLKVINCLRNPLEVAQSLAYRNGFPPAFTMDLWKTYWDAVLTDPCRTDQLITHYDSFFINPHTELRRLLDFIGLPVGEQIINSACETTMPNLRHNRSTIGNLVNAGAPPKVTNLYAKLCLQAGPIYWDTTRNNLREIPLIGNDKDYAVENSLLVSLTEGDPLIQTLIGQVFEKEQRLQSLAAQVKAKELEISTLATESKNLRDLTLHMPGEALKVFAYVWRIFTKIAPPNSRRERSAVLLVKGLIKLYRRIYEIKYQNWISKFDVVSARKNEIVLAEIESFAIKPLLTVLMPVYAPPIEHLNEAINSVRAQLYANWELCIADDASPNSLVRDLIEKHAREDSRIRFVFRNSNGHISASSNSALELATGEFTALLDHDDVLHPLALYHVAKTINSHPEVEVIYSDEDLLNERGKRIGPYFKSDFDYDLFLSQNMVSHLGVYRTETLRKVGGFRLGFEGSQDYDLMLRVIEMIKLDQIKHIPRVLYHWRVSNQSAAAGTEAKPYAYEAGLKALKEHLKRKKIEALVEFVPGSYSHRIKYSPPQPLPTVNIIFCVHGFSKALEQCVNSILSNTTYTSFHVSIYSIHETGITEHDIYKQWRQNHRITFVKALKGANPVALMSQAVMDSKTDYFCLLDEYTYGFPTDWLDLLIGLAAQFGIGAVGPLLLDSNEKLLGNGIILTPDEIDVKLFSGQSKFSSYHGWAMLQKGYSAISDMGLLVKRSHFMEAGGFSETLQTRHYATIDLCLKLKEMGLRNVIVPSVELYHHRDVTHNRESLPELESDKIYIKNHWQKWLDLDPAFSPNLKLKKGKFVFATSQRVKNLSFR